MARTLTWAAQMERAPLRESGQNIRSKTNAPRTLDLVVEHIRRAFAHLGLLKD